MDGNVMKLTVKWVKNEVMNMVCEVYLDRQRIYGCRKLEVDGLAFYPAKDCVLKGEKEGYFIHQNGTVKEII